MAFAHVQSSPPGTANKTLRYTADQADINPNMGFIPEVDGGISIKLRHDPALVVHQVLKGHFYPLDIAEFDVDGGAVSQAITVYFRVA